MSERKNPNPCQKLKRELKTEKWTSLKKCMHLKRIHPKLERNSNIINTVKRPTQNYNAAQKYDKPSLSLATIDDIQIFLNKLEQIDEDIQNQYKKKSET